MGNNAKRWGEYLLPLSKQHKDPDISSVFSYDSNATEASTNQKKQSTSYKPIISEITTIQRPPITRYGADIPKEVLDNIPVFEGKQGVPKHHRIFLHNVQGMQSRPHTTTIWRKGTQDHKPHNSRRSRCRMVRHQEKTHKQLWIHKKWD